MHLRRLAIAALTLLTLAGGAALSTLSAAAPPAPGAGSVIAMHEQFFRALDAGDTRAAQGFLDTRADLHLFLCDPAGAPLSCATRAEGLALIERWQKSATKLTALQATCDSPDSSYAIFELERTPLAGAQGAGAEGGAAEHMAGGAECCDFLASAAPAKPIRYRLSSIVRWDKSQWRIVHLHLSRA
jgi:hypothetical protein